MARTARDTPEYQKYLTEKNKPSDANPIPPGWTYNPASGKYTNNKTGQSTIVRPTGPDFQNPTGVGDLGDAIVSPFNEVGTFVDQNFLGGAERDANQAGANALRAEAEKSATAIGAVGDKSQEMLKPWLALGTRISGKEENTPSYQEILADKGSGMVGPEAASILSQTGGPGYSEQLYQARQNGQLDPWSQRQLELGQRSLGDASAAFGSTRSGATTEAAGNLTKDILADQYRRMDALAGMADTGMNARLRTGLTAAQTNEGILSDRAAGADTGRLSREKLALDALGEPTQYATGINTATGLAANEARTNLDVGAISGDTAARTSGAKAWQDLLKTGAGIYGNWVGRQKT